MSSVAEIPQVNDRGQVIPKVADLPVYYENGKGFLLFDGARDFIELTETGVRRYLDKMGVPKSDPLRRHAQSPMDLALFEIQTTKVVDFAGPLAGRSPGLHVINGSRVLVKGAPKIIEPDPTVEWPLLRRLLTEMFGPLDGVQLTHLVGWVKVGYTALRRGSREPGQALALAGPADCGKSLAQSLIRECLGGRTANPHPFMTGKTPFNKDLFGAEVLSFGDEMASTHMVTRQNFGAALKQLTVNADQRCHAKGRDAITLDPLWRVTMSLNDEPENIAVLPPLEKSIEDKLILLKTARPALFDTPEWSNARRDENWSKLVAELPGFLYHVSEFKIPAALRSARFGIAHYHHPDLLAALGALSSESRLLELVDMALFGRTAEELPEKTAPWEGTAARLEQKLRQSDLRDQVGTLLRWPGACGAYLTNLCRICPERVIELSGRKKTYRIEPPPADKTE